MKRQEVDLTLVLETLSKASKVKFVGADLDSGEGIRVENEPVSGALTFDNRDESNGDYDLQNKMINGGKSLVFSHADIEMGKTYNHMVNFGLWDGEKPLVLEIDEDGDGTIDKKIRLDNEGMAGCAIYLPTIG